MESSNAAEPLVVDPSVEGEGQENPKPLESLRTPKTPKIEKSPISPIPVITRKVLISVDNSDAQVLEYDKGGLELTFDSAPSRFLCLNPETVGKLSVSNRTSYVMSEKSHQVEVEQAGDVPTDGLSVYPAMSTPSRRLSVRFKDAETQRAFEARWHLCWKRPDELQYALSEGYRKVGRDDGVISFAYDPERGIHVVGAAGTPELILLKCSKEVYAGKIQEAEEQSRRQNGAVESSFDATAKDAGFQAYHPNASQVDKSLSGG